MGGIVSGVGSWHKEQYLRVKSSIHGRGPFGDTLSGSIWEIRVNEKKKKRKEKEKTNRASFVRRVNA